MTQSMSQPQQAWPQQNGSHNPHDQAPFDVKTLECWYWANGGCTWGDDECRYAHWPTGKTAERPLRKANGFSVAGRNATIEQPVYRRWQGRNRHHSTYKGDIGEGAWLGQHESQPPSFYAPDEALNEHTSGYVDPGRNAHYDSSNETLRADGENIRGRARPQAPEPSEKDKWPRARSRSPYTGRSLPARRRRSPRSSVAPEGKDHKGSELRFRASTTSENNGQTHNNGTGSTAYTVSANSKHGNHQTQTGISKEETPIESIYTVPFRQLPNAAQPATNLDKLPLRFSEIPQEQAPASGEAMDALLAAVDQHTSLATNAAGYGNERGLLQPPMQQQYSEAINPYREMQSTPREVYGYREPSPTMVSMPMSQYSQMRAHHDSVQRELYHYRSHNYRAEQVIEYQTVLLTEAQSLLHDGKKLLTDEGRLAMDLSQKIQRGDTIHPDIVTDAWLGATDMLRQAGSFSTMLDEWSRSVDHTRNGSTSSMNVNPLGEPGHQVATPMVDQVQQN